MAKVSIKKASKGLNKFNLNSDHKTTSDFGQMQVSQFLPVVPGDKININMSVEARFAPMAVPTFMSVNLYNRAFFVPMDAIFHQFENYYTNKQDSSALKFVPNFTNNVLVTFILHSNKGLVVDITDYYNEDMVYDVFKADHYYLFTEKGRLFLKLLHSLGYSINWSSSDTTSFMALPLMAFMRVVYDYIYPAQYVDSLGLTKYFNITSSSDFTDFSTDVSSGANSQFFAAIVDLLSLPYKQDYFTAAWKNLNQPGSATQNITQPDVNPDVSILPSSNNNVSARFGASSSLLQYGISQQGLNILSRLYDFVTRNNLVGTRFADQIFARFGIGSRKSDPDMSVDLGRLTTPISVQDVTQMASTGEGLLGELGGKSYLSNNGHLLKFDSDRFGYIVVLSYLMPDVGYYQGRKLWTIHKSSRFDNFYTPEFDLQMRAIRNDELFADYHNSADYTAGQSYGGNPNGRFGFAPNYSEYKKGNDYLTGDFRIPSLARNLNSYHLLRDIPVPSQKEPLSLSSPFLFCNQHSFDKIYQQIYSLRYPLGKSVIVEGESVREFLSLNNKVIALCEDSTPEDTDAIYLLQIREDGKFHWCMTSYSNVSSLDVDFMLVEMTFPSSTVLNFTVLGKLWSCPGVEHVLSSELDYIRGKSWDSTLYDSNDVPVVSFDEFLLPYSDYIDHAYLHYYFQIEAYRPMATISEEFQIEDGGNLESVDLLGNRN